MSFFTSLGAAMMREAEERAVSDGLKRVSIEVSLLDVDPELLGILTGGVVGTPPAPTFSLTAAYPARRRTFWEWLRRRPRHHAGTVYFPAVSLGAPDADQT